MKSADPGLTGRAHSEAAFLYISSSLLLPPSTPLSFSKPPLSGPSHTCPYHHQTCYHFWAPSLPQLGPPLKSPLSPPKTPEFVFFLPIQNCPSMSGPCVFEKLLSLSLSQAPPTAYPYPTPTIPTSTLHLHHCCHPSLWGTLLWRRPHSGMGKCNKSGQSLLALEPSPLFAIWLHKLQQATCPDKWKLYRKVLHKLLWLLLS